MRDAIAIGTLALVILVAAQVYGGDSDPEVVVDLPAATAVRPHVYPDGSLSPDYMYAAVLALQTALDQALTDYRVLKNHDAMIHSGFCILWGER